MKLFEKILEVQKELKPIVKDSENPFFKSKYFDINAVIAELRPLLSKHGLVVLQPLTEIAGKPAIKTVVIEAESGEIFAEVTPLMESNDIQKFGGIITYTRRYALASMFLLEAEDDDAEGVVRTAKEEPKKDIKDTKNCIGCGAVHTGAYSKCRDCYFKK